MDERTGGVHLLDLHHTGAEELNTQAVRDYHINSRGYGDIGYNMVIERDGTVGIGRDLKWAGAHDPGVAPGQTASMNQVSFGLSHIGNFEEHEMPEVQFQSSIHEAAKICKLYAIPVNTSWVRRHKDQYATDCPGRFFPYTRYLSELSKLLTPPPVSVREQQYMIVVANPSLNVRSSPKVVSGNIIGSLPNGTKVKIGWIKDGWANIYFGDHGGFVAAKYLR